MTDEYDPSRDPEFLRENWGISWAEVSKRPVDDNHALLIGAVLGACLRFREVQLPYEVEVIDDAGGNHLDTFRIHTPTSGTYLVSVKKEG